MATAKKKAKTASKAPAAKKNTAARRPSAKAPVASKKSAAKTVAATTADTATFYEYMTHGAGVTKTIKTEGAPRFFGAAEATSLPELTLLVQTRMNDGWIPAGGINVAAKGTFVQALIRY